eukprot:s4211_g1.t1
MLSTHEDAVRRESNTLIIFKHDALDKIRVWRTQIGYLLCADEVPLSWSCGIWSLRCRCWYQKPSDSDLSEMTDLSGPKDLMCHIWHLQLIYDKRQQLGAAADKWSRQQYTEYVLRAMQDADVTANMLEAMYKEMPENQRGYVNLENDTPNERDHTQPADEDQERIQFMKQTLFEMQAKAIKKYLKKRDGGVVFLLVFLLCFLFLVFECDGVDFPWTTDSFGAMSRRMDLGERADWTHWDRSQACFALRAWGAIVCGSN